MSKFSRREFLVTLDISCLRFVRDALKENGVSNARWYDLGIELELGPSELDAIKSDYPNASICLLKCLEKWLKGRRNRTWEVLGRALKRMDETAAAEKISDTYGDLASQLLQKLYKGKLSDIVFSEDSTEMLHEKGLITEDEQRSLDDNNGSMTVDSLKEVLFAVAEDHEKLRTFGHILLESDEGIGSKILQCCDQLIPSRSIPHDAMAKVECKDQTKVVYKSEAHEVVFDEFRVKSANAREKIAKSMTPLIPSCEEIKIYLRIRFPELKEKLVDVDEVEGVVNVVKIECTIINIVPMKAIADNYNCDDAKELIEQYNKDLDCFCENEVALVLHKDLLSPRTSLFDKITFVLNWRPDEHKLKDIRRLLEKAFKDLSQRVIVKRIGDENSINIVCFAPNHLLDALLLAAQDSVATLIEEFCLIRLTIGHYTVYNKAIKDKEIQTIAQEVEQANNERKKLAFLVTKKKDFRLKVEYHRTVLEVQKLHSLYILKGNEMKQKGEIALLSSQCKEMSEEMSKMRIDLEGVAKELNEEKKQMPSKIRSELQPLKDDLALQRHYVRQKEALTEYDGSLKESELSHKMTHLLKDNEEFRNELKATKEEYGKRIATLSENMKNKESQLSREITRLSEENEELRSKLKATKEEYDGNLSKNIEEICWPMAETDSREDGTEFIVTNVDQGNTVAGELLKKLLGNIKILHTQLEVLEKQLTQLTDKESISQKDITDLKGAFEDHVTKFQNMQELSSEITACHSKENELQSELKAAKEEYDKKIRSLSETIVAMETKLSTKENKLQSELKATKEEYNEKIKSLSENIEKIRQPPLESDAAGDNASTPIIALLSTLDELATQMVSKETTNKRRSMMESHDNEFHTAHDLLTQDIFDDSITGSPILRCTYSGSSSGRGTLGRSDSNKLFSTEEGEISQSEGQGSSQATDVQQLLPPSASKVLLHPKKTTGVSTTAVHRAQSISEKEHNYLGVVWAMSDLTIAIKKLLETDPSN